VSKLGNFCSVGAAALACLCSGVFGPASAQTPSASPLAGIPIYDSVSAAGQNLAKNYGIYMDFSYTEDFSALVAGGQRTGIQPIGETFANVILDLQTLLDITGASFHIAFDERNGIPIGTIGGIAATSGILQASAGPTKYRLVELYWEQGFDNDRLDILVGRTQPTFDFAFATIGCDFVSSIICAQPGTWYGATNNQGFPGVEWGARINFQVTPQLYVRTGAYEDDPSQGGFIPAGFNLNVEHATGVFVPMEIGYLTSFRDAAYPVKYDIGGYFDTSDFTRPNGTVGNGRQAFWAQGEQTIWRPDRATNQSLRAFAGAIIYSGNEDFWGQYYAGLFDYAPFGKARPGDTVGFIGTLYKDNVGYLPNSYNGNQWLFELNYGARIIPGLTFKPYAQAVIGPDNPNNITNSFGSRKLNNDWVLGFQVVLDLAQLFQWPQFVPH
jgi:porin